MGSAGQAPAAGENSLLESATSRSPTQTLRRAGSTTISPTRQGPSRPPMPRRSTAPIRARSSWIVKRLDHIVIGAESRPRTRSASAPRPVRTITGRPGSKRERDPVGLADLAQHVEPGGVGQGQVEQQQIGVVVAAEPQGVGSARRRQHAEAVGDEVIAEQLQGRRVVLADDQARDLSSLGKHLAPLSPQRRKLSPLPGGNLPICNRVSSSAARPVAVGVEPVAVFADDSHRAGVARAIAAAAFAVVVGGAGIQAGAAVFGSSWIPLLLQPGFRFRCFCCCSPGPALFAGRRRWRCVRRTLACARRIATLCCSRWRTCASRDCCVSTDPGLRRCHPSRNPPPRSRGPRTSQEPPADRPLSRANQISALVCPLCPQPSCRWRHLVAASICSRGIGAYLTRYQGQEKMAAPGQLSRVGKEPGGAAERRAGPRRPCLCHQGNKGRAGSACRRCGYSSSGGSADQRQHPRGRDVKGREAEPRGRWRSELRDRAQR